MQSNFAKIRSLREGSIHSLHSIGCCGASVEASLYGILANNYRSTENASKVPSNLRLLGSYGVWCDSIKLETGDFQN